MEKKVLILCYAFPPHPGIGGRRWAKFAKYLASQDYRVEVFNAENIFNETSLWNDDVQHPLIRIHSFRFTFQELFKNPGTLAAKTMRKCMKLVIDLTKYTPEMITSFPNKKIWKAVEEKIASEKIKTVIVSGDPYLFYYATQLANRADVELILDYRDLWNDHSFYSKNIRLTGKQKSYFEFCENYALNHCDKIIAVDQGLVNTLSKRIKGNKDKMFVVHNGFDPDDAAHIAKRLEPHEEKIRLFFSGSISSDMNGILLGFISAFAQLKQTDPGLFHRFEMRIHGTVDHVLRQSIEKHGLSNVTVNSDYFSKRDYYQLASDYEIGMILVSEEYRHSFATKFSDFLHLGKFIVAICPKGDFSDFIRTNKLGIAFENSMGPVFFETLYKQYKAFKPHTGEHLKKFELKGLTDQLMNIMES